MISDLEPENSDRVPDELPAALASMARDGNDAPLARWLERELDSDGTPARLPTASWWPSLAALRDHRAIRHGDWSPVIETRYRLWFENALRWLRPDGTLVFSPPGSATVWKRYGHVRTWGTHDGARVGPSGSLDGSARRNPPPTRVRWIVRNNLGRRSDWVAVDHADPDGPNRVEIGGLGIPWLGPRWDEPTRHAQTRIDLWRPQGDLFEWGDSAGSRQTLRTVALLREPRVALIAQQGYSGDASGTLTIRVADGIQAEPATDGGVLLQAPNGIRAVVIPLATPFSQAGTVAPALSVSVDGRSLRYGPWELGTPNRIWLPLLIVWDPRLRRRAPFWRTVTVAERSRPCPPAVASAMRVSWGRSETLVVYRSLVRPAQRSFLGHQTRARLLIGRWTRTGEVVPLLSWT